MLPEVENHVWVSQVGGWVSLLGVDEIWEFHWVVDEEDWGVVSNHIVVTLLGVELNGKTSWVSNSIWGTSLTSNSGESQEAWGLLTNFVKELGLGELGDILGDFHDTVSSSSLSMDNSLWDSFSIEMSEFIDEVEVLKENWSLWASGH